MTQYKKTCYVYCRGLVLAFWVLLSISHQLFAQNIVEVGGIYSQDQLWTPDNEYHVVDNVRILSGVSLRIEAGTIVKFNQGRSLNIESGRLHIDGAPSDSVIMKANRAPDEAWNWTGIIISSVTQPGDILINHVRIEDAEVGLRSVSSQNLLITNSHIANNRNVGIILFNSSYNTLQNNLISNNFLGLEIHASGPGNFSQYNQVLQNVFTNPTTNILIHNNNQGACPHNTIEENLIQGGIHGIWLFNSASQGGTGHVVINRNTIINNGTATDGYGIYVSMDSTNITHNIFWRNTNAINIIEAQKTHFLNNSVYENKRGITMRTNAKDVGFLNNTITATEEYVLKANFADQALIAQNNIFGSLPDSAIMQNFSTQQLNIANNYWGTSNGTLIEKLLSPSANNWFYEPFLPEPNTQAPVSPPRAVVAQLINGNVRLQWKPNPETDVIGYHIYTGNFKDYSFSEAAVFTADTFFLLPAASFNGPVAVTALDEGGFQNGAQLSGNESPFSFAKPMPYAGEDIVVCENVLHVSLNQSTLPQGFTNSNWLSRGDGSFENAGDLRTFYFPGEQDLENGLVTLVIEAGHDDVSFFDSISVRFERQAIVFAGNRALISTDSLYVTAEATASNFSALWWSGTGDGSFDRPDSLLAVYTPGPNDLLNGEVKLILQAFSDYCNTVSDTMLLTIKNAWSLEGRLWAANEKLPLHPVIAVKNEAVAEIQTHFLTYTDTEGIFRFPSLFEGDYRLFAPLDTIGMEAFLPSYYVNNSRWQQAYGLMLKGDTYEVDLHLLPKQSLLPFGNASLKGHFSLEGFGRENSETYCRPWFDALGGEFCNDGLSNATVLLFGESRERIYAHTLTDANGNFFFNDLPFGTFVIEVDVAGFESAVSQTIRLSPEQSTVSDIALQIEGENKIGIYLPTQSQAIPQVQAYPNPTFDKVFVNTSAFDCDRKLRINIYSPEGRLVQATQATTTNQSLVIDLSGLKAGIYIIKLTDGQKEVVFLQGKR